MTRPDYGAIRRLEIELGFREPLKTEAEYIARVKEIYDDIEAANRESTVDERAEVEELFAGIKVFREERSVAKYSAREAYRAINTLGHI